MRLTFLFALAIMFLCISLKPQYICASTYEGSDSSGTSTSSLEQSYWNGTYLINKILAGYELSISSDQKEALIYRTRKLIDEGTDTDIRLAFFISRNPSISACLDTQQNKLTALAARISEIRSELQTPGDYQLASEHFTHGITCFNNAISENSTDEMLNALEYFQSAVNALGTLEEESSDLHDRIFFFGGLSQVALLGDPYSDNQSDIYARLGDFLDDLGFSEQREDYTRIQYPENCTIIERDGFLYQECAKEPLPEEAPRSSEIQTFLFDKVIPELNSALEMLDKVSIDFNYSWKDPLTYLNVEFDYADALFMQAALSATCGQIYVQQAYNLDADLYVEQNLFNTNAQRTLEQALHENPDLGTLSAQHSELLQVAKGYLNRSAEYSARGLEEIQNEKDQQEDDFITFYVEECMWTSSGEQCVENIEAMNQKISSYKAYIADFKLALDEPVYIEKESYASTGSEIYDFSRFFNGVDLRSLAPALNGDTPSMFPDPTFDGIIVESDLHVNQDLDADGSPDLLVNFSRFSEALVSNEQYEILWSDCGITGTLTFNPDRTYEYTWRQSSADSISQYSSGSWVLDQGKVILEGEWPMGFKMQILMEDGNGTKGGDISFTALWSQDDYPVCFGYWEN